MSPSCRVDGSIHILSWTSLQLELHLLIWLPEIPGFIQFILYGVLNNFGIPWNFWSFYSCQWNLCRAYHTVSHECKAPHTLAVCETKHLMISSNLFSQGCLWYTFQDHWCSWCWTRTFDLKLHLYNELFSCSHLTLWLG